MTIDEILASLSADGFRALLEDAPPKGAWELQPREWTRFLPEPAALELQKHNLVILQFCVFRPEVPCWRCELTARGQAASKAARELHAAQGALKGPVT